MRQVVPGAISLWGRDLVISFSWRRRAESRRVYLIFFFFQAEDGIRDLTVTGVQTCALPIFLGPRDQLQRGVVGLAHARAPADRAVFFEQERPRLGVRRDGVGRLARDLEAQIGRASCRERV